MKLVVWLGFCWWCPISLHPVYSWLYFLQSKAEISLSKRHTCNLLSSLLKTP